MHGNHAYDGKGACHIESDQPIPATSRLPAASGADGVRTSRQ
jgi:hypothetical protein